MLMLNTISPHIILLPELTLSYKVKQDVIYRLAIAYIYYNKMSYIDLVSLIISDTKSIYDILL